MTAPTPFTRCGKVTVQRSTDPETSRTVIRAAVSVDDWTHEVIGQLAELWEQSPAALTDKLDAYLVHRADEIQSAGKPSAERDARARMRDTLDELLELADVAPDPTVLLGRDEVAAIARAHLDATLAGSPLVAERAA